MAVSYKKLFHLMIDKGMTNAELMEKAGFVHVATVRDLSGLDRVVCGCLSPES